MKIKILFDKESDSNQYSCGWGISYLIGETTLFDAGEKPQYLIENMRRMQVDPCRIENLIISHNHWDHRGGVWSIIGDNKQIKVFSCSDFFEEFKEQLSGHQVCIVEGQRKISDTIYTTGCCEVTYKGSLLKEQALIVCTEKGISVICGCAHPGVLNFLKIAKGLFPGVTPYSVIGGFHFIDKDKRFIHYMAQQLKKEGVLCIGPSHCTGFEAINILRQYYGEDFFEIKVGIDIEV